MFGIRFETKRRGKQSY